MLKIERVRAGEDAVRALTSAITVAKGGDAFTPVTVVTPTARAAVHLLPLTSRQVTTSAVAGLANVTFVVLERLARELARDAPDLAGRTPLTRAALFAACRSALLAAPGLFAPVADHPSTVAEIVDRYEELRVAPRALDVLARRGAVPAGLAAVAREIRRRVVDRSYDDVDLLTAAAAQVRSGEVALDSCEVIVYGPERLRPIEAALLLALAERREVRVLLAETGDPIADGPLRGMEALLEGSSTVAGKDIVSAGAMGLGSGGRFDALALAPDPQSEVRDATRRVLTYLASGAAPESVAVVYSRPTPYAVLLRGELDRAGIPWSGPSPEHLTTAPTAQFLQALLALRPERVARRTLMALLNAAPMHLAGAGNAGHVAEWDRCSRLVGITEGSISDWLRRLAELGREAGRLSVTAVDPLAPQSPRPIRARRTASGCAELAALLEDLARFLESARAVRGLGALSSWARACLSHFLGSDEHRGAWPAGIGEADARIVALLDELAALDDLEPDVGLEQFATVLAAELDRPRPAVGRLGTGVIVGPLDQVVGLQLGLVVVLGCSEGDLPRRPPLSPLLAAGDREVAELDDHGALAEEMRDCRRVQLVIAAGETTIATSPALDPRAGRVRVPSRFASGATTRYEVAGAEAAFVEVAAGAPALNAGELDCALLLEAGRIGLDARLHFLPQREPELASGLVTVLARRYEPFGAYDGGVGPHELASRTGLAVAPTTLEDFATCPFRYLIAHALGCEAIDEPEHRVVIDPRDRGSIVHEVLERYVAELVDTRAAGDSASSAARAARLAEIAEDVFGRYERLGRTGKRVLWELERRRLLRLLERERVEDERRQQATGRRPLAVEHVFGIGAAPPVAVAIGNRPVAFRGRIDRIDATVDGGLAVVDYKTGRADGFRQLREDPVDRGRHLQLPIYALAARAAYPDAPEGGISAAFRFVGQGSEEVEFVLDEAGTDRFEEALGTIFDQIAAGLFPYHPGNGSENCRFCDFDGLCPSGRAANWERARHAPGLAAYVALAEPEEPES